MSFAAGFGIVRSAGASGISARPIMLEQLLGSTPGTWLLILLLAAIGTLITVGSWWAYEMIARWWQS